MAGIDLHFVHGRKAVSTQEGQLAAAIGEVLLPGLQPSTHDTLDGVIRSQNPDFRVVQRRLVASTSGGCPIA